MFNIWSDKQNDCSLKITFSKITAETIKTVKGCVQIFSLIFLSFLGGGEGVTGNNPAVPDPSV